MNEYIKNISWNVPPNEPKNDIITENAGSNPSSIAESNAPDEYSLKNDTYDG